MRRIVISPQELYCYINRRKVGNEYKWNIKNETKTTMCKWVQRNP